MTPTRATSCASSRSTGAPASRSTPSRCRTSPRTATRAPIRAWTCATTRRRGWSSPSAARSSAPASTRRSSATTTTGRCTPTTAARPTIRPTRSTPPSLLSNPAARHYLAGTAFHCYSGDPERQSVLHDAFPQKDIYFTECSGSQSGDPATTFPDTLHWHTRFLTVGAVRNWAKTVITWNLALDPSGGPHNGGCGTCFGVVTIDPATGHATPTADYYVLGHVTRFIRPGAVRIDSTVAGNAWNVAFRNPDGSIVLVVVNDDWGTTTQRFDVSAGGAVVLLRPAGGRGGDLRAARGPSRLTCPHHPPIGGICGPDGPGLRFNPDTRPVPPDAVMRQAAGRGVGARRPRRRRETLCGQALGETAAAPRRRPVSRLVSSCGRPARRRAARAGPACRSA